MSLNPRESISAVVHVDEAAYGESVQPKHATAAVLSQTVFVLGSY